MTAASRMEKIGLIGGLSWVATAQYYRRLNEITQARCGGVRSPRLILESVDRQAYVDAVITRGDEAAAAQMIREAARAVEAGGAAFIVICCNDVHRFVEAIAPELSIPFLHIADATAREILARGQRKVGLIGVRKTMEAAFYPERLATMGIEVILPDEPDRAYVHTTIYDELVHDVFRDETRRGYADVIGRLAARGAEGVVLGCTEIPLLIDEGQAGVPLYATTEIHCRAAIDWALGRGARPAEA